MNNLNKTARTVGALFLISNATFLLGAMVLIEPGLTAPDYLLNIPAISQQLIWGALLELINGVAYIGIAVLMFPILRQRYESLALGYVAFRIIEFITQLAASIVPLVLVTLSGTGTPVSQAMGDFLLATRYWSFEMLSLVFALSALMFYFMLYQTRLVPRFISAWGFIAAALVFTNTLLEVLGIDLGTAVGYVTGLPMLLNELFLGVWLLVKGFSSDAVIYDPVEAVVSPGQLRTS
jgi:hypothetical protein